MKIMMNAKCSDMFGCTIEDGGKELLSYDGYVPNWMPGEHYGDYVELDIDSKTGKILNWKANADKLIKAFIEKQKGSVTAANTEKEAGFTGKSQVWSAMNLKNMKLGQTVIAEPEDKDIKRLIDMGRKAGGDMAKLAQLAGNMAKAITGRDKAIRRAEAAEKILKGKEAKMVSQIFRNRADEL